MTALDRQLARSLADWKPGEFPVTTVYLSVDGRQYPRTQDYEVRLDELLRRAHDTASELDKGRQRSVEQRMNVPGATAPRDGLPR